MLPKQIKIGLCGAGIRGGVRFEMGIRHPSDRDGRNHDPRNDPPFARDHLLVRRACCPAVGLLLASLTSQPLEARDSYVHTHL